MIPISRLKAELSSNGFENELYAVYVSPAAVTTQRQRLTALLDSFASLFGAQREVELFSAPGRTEVGGNHTDHNHGRVLAAGINLDAVAAVSRTSDNRVRVQSEGFAMDSAGLDCLDPLPHERGKSVALVRGVCAGFRRRGYAIGGFDAYTFSDVFSGSGLSSSAAYEVLLGTILNHLFNDGRIDPVEIAQIAQFAENEFFGKPCGLMDQTASSVGGFVTIDFNDPAKPIIEKIDFDFSSCGHALCIVDTGGSHSDLTEEYAAVRKEMEAVAAQFGQKTLRDVAPALLNERLPAVRQVVGDRALLRAKHFYADNERVLKQARALNSGDFEQFKKLIIESGRSSYMFNQNVYTSKNPREQQVALALCLSEEILTGRGAWRVHGGGFAGTIQAFVPLDMLEDYKASMESVFRVNACYVLSVRPVGGVKILG